MSGRGKYERRVIRHYRIRKRVNGTEARPRLSIFLSNRQMYVQFIDDVAGVTLAAASSGSQDKGHNVAGAVALGKCAADAARAKGIQDFVVDRGGFKYHGRLKAIVEALRAAGIGAGSNKET